MARFIGFFLSYLIIDLRRHKMDPATTANEAFLQIGVGGIFTILVLREVFGFLAKSKWWMRRNGNSNGRPLDASGTFIERRQPSEAYTRMLSQVDHLHTSQHADAIHLAHTREMLEKAVDRLAETVDSQSDALQNISQATNQSCKSLVIVQQKLTEISITMHARPATP
jgi:hypothetical protein